MSSKTFIIRSHTRTIHTQPVTFVCKRCGTPTTRECYPGPAPKYCLKCSPKRKRHNRQQIPEKGMFQPTHYLVDKTGKTTSVCLVPTKNKDWQEVRTALDWFSGASTIQYSKKHGLQSQGVDLVDYSIVEMEVPQANNDVAMKVVETNNDEVVKVPQKSSKKSQKSLTQRPYSLREICRRFRCGDRLLRKMRELPDFKKWSQSRDPNNVSWEYRSGKYHPLM